jgi:hypothetical protein
LYTSHWAAGSPAASEVAASAASPFCVGAQTSQRSGVQRAVAFIGSIVAWFWNGYEYTASMRRAAEASAPRASPCWLPMKASGASRPAFSVAAMSALDSLALGPSSHSTGSASSAVLARHHVSATTATAESPTRTTFFTPGLPWIAAASKLFSLPPTTGQSLIAALSMPGSFRSLA